MKKAKKHHDFTTYVDLTALELTCKAKHQDFDEKFLTYQIECMDEIQVNPQDVLDVRSGVWSPTPSTGLQKWALCLLVKAGIMSNEGVYKLDEALNKVEPQSQELIEEELNACIPQERLLPHERAWEFLRCYNNDHKNFTILRSVQNTSKIQ